MIPGLREELLGRGIVLSYVTVMLVTTTEGTMNLLFPLFLDQRGYLLAGIGTIASLFAVMQLVSRVPVGAAYHASTARRQLAFWLVVFALSTSGYAIVGASLPLIIALTLVHGFAFGALGTLNLAQAIDITGGRKAGPVMGWYTASLSLGYALGAFVGGALADRIGLGGALALVGLLPLLGLVAVGLAPVTPGVARPPRVTGGVLGRALGAWRSIDGRVWLAFVIVLFLNTMSDSVDTFFPLFGTVALGLPVAALGALKGVKSAAATVVRFLSGAVFRFVDFRVVNVWGLVVMSVATIVLAHVGSYPALVVVFVVLGVCRGLLRVTSAATIAGLRSEGKDVGLASGVYNAGLDLGAIIGPAVGGILGTIFGLGMMFQLVAGGSLVIYLVIALASPSGRKGLSILPPRQPAGATRPGTPTT